MRQQPKIKEVSAVNRRQHGCRESVATLERRIEESSLFAFFHYLKNHTKEKTGFCGETVKIKNLSIDDGDDNENVTI